MTAKRTVMAFVWLVLACGSLTSPVLAQQGDAEVKRWSKEKCERYGRAWEEILNRWGTEGISTEFLSRHTTFVKDGCTARANVCPRSKREFEIADMLSVSAINFGATGSFLPFACRD